MSITAIVVAAHEGYLERTLKALADQRQQPDQILLVDAREHGEDEDFTRASGNAGIEAATRVVIARDARTFGDGVDAALEGLEEDPGEWLWLLHDDSPPEPDALAELARATSSARAVGIAGTKQVDLDDPTRLISVGVRLTRSGRRISEIESGEIDQGQYDDREDVFAVGTAGMLIRARTWSRTGGTDPHLGPFLDGAELSRRVRLSGERVIVVPTAKVRHARASLWHGRNRSGEHPRGRNSFLARRISTLHLRLITANAWLLPLIVISMVLAGPIRAMWRIAANDLDLAWQEVKAPFMALSRVGAIHARRRRISRSTTVGRKVLRPLYATRSEVWRLWWHRWRAARVERRRRVAPSELEIAERRTITIRRRVTLLVLVLALVGISAVIYPRVFGGTAFSLPGLVGGGLAGVDQSYGDLWQRALSGWTPVGDGAPVPPHPFAFVLAVLASVFELPFGAPPSTAVNLLLAFGVPLAGISAWFAVGGVSRSVLLRGWTGLVWGLLPVLTVAIGHGRPAATLSHILLPLFGLALLRTFGVDRRDVIRSGMEGAGEEGTPTRIPVLAQASGRVSSGAAAAAGLLLAVISASTPILLPALSVVVIASALVAGHSRRRALLVLIPPLILFAPQILHGVRHGWGVIFESIERTPVSLSPFSADGSDPWSLIPWHVPSGWVDAPTATIPAAVVAGLLGLAAVVGLIRTGLPGAVARWGWGLMILGVAVATGSQFVLKRPQYDWLGSFQLLPEWAGPGVSLAGAGLILAAGAALSKAGRTLQEKEVGATHVVVGIGVLGLVAAVVGGGINTVASLTETPQWQVRATQPLPALARQSVNGPERTRVLVLAPNQDSIAAQLWRSNGPQLLDRVGTDPGEDPARIDLENLAAEIYAGTATDPGSRLGAHAIGFILLPSADSPLVVVDPPSAEELIAALDGLAVLERVTENEAGLLWRVASTGSRVRIVQGSEETEVPSGLITVATTLPDLPSSEPGTLVLSERADPHWRAVLDGRELRSVNLDWRQSFELPADASGVVKIDYQPFAHRVWRVGLIAVFGFTLLLAVPLRRRPEVVA